MCSEPPLFKKKKKKYLKNRALLQKEWNLSGLSTMLGENMKYSYSFWIRYWDMTQYHLETLALQKHLY